VEEQILEKVYEVVTRKTEVDFEKPRGGDLKTFLAKKETASALAGEEIPNKKGIVTMCRDSEEGR